MLKSLSSVCLVWLAASSPVHGAPLPATDLPSAATHIADKLEKAHRQNVIVTDFMDSKNRVSALGKKLAADLSTALENFNQHLQVLPRENAIAASGGFGGSNMLEQEALIELSRMTGAEAIIVGRLKLASGLAEVDLAIWDLRAFEMPNAIGAEELEEFVIRIPLAAGDEQLASRILPGNPTAQYELSAGLEEPKFPSPPRCNRCEMFTSEKGPVELMVTIDKNGRVTKAEVTSAPNEKAGQKFVREVMKWTFRPGLDEKGQPTEAQLKYVFGANSPVH